MVDRELGAAVARLVLRTCVVALLCCGASDALAAPLSEPPAYSGPRFEPGHVIVRYRPGTDDAERAAAGREVGALSGEAIGLARAEMLRLPAGRTEPGGRRSREPAGRGVRPARLDLPARGDPE